MAIGNAELMHQCFLKHLPMLTARMKEDKETEGIWRGFGNKYRWHQKKKSQRPNYSSGHPLLDGGRRSCHIIINNCGIQFKIM